MAVIFFASSNSFKDLTRKYFRDDVTKSKAEQLAELERLSLSEERDARYQRLWERLSESDMKKYSKIQARNDLEFFQSENIILGFTEEDVNILSEKRFLLSQILHDRTGKWTAGIFQIEFGDILKEDVEVIAHLAEISAFIEGLKISH